jgi:hypothetical protein
MEITRSLFYFVLAGLCEIGGGRLALAEGKQANWRWFGRSSNLGGLGLFLPCNRLTLGGSMRPTVASLLSFPFSGAGGQDRTGHV